MGRTLVEALKGLGNVVVDHVAAVRLLDMRWSAAGVVGS